MRNITDLQYKVLTDLPASCWVSRWGTTGKSRLRKSTLEKMEREGLVVSRDHNDPHRLGKDEKLWQPSSEGYAAYLRMKEMKETVATFTVDQIVASVPSDWRDAMAKFLEKYQEDWLHRMGGIPGLDPKRRPLNPHSVWMYDVPVSLDINIKGFLLKLSEKPFWVVFEP